MAHSEEFRRGSGRLFISKKSHLKAAMQDPTEATTNPSPLQESPMGNTGRLEEVSVQRHQEKVEACPG
ncbi:hypothetical protein KSB_63520 [Ktedonobacter robiniae]|uniref:Uncharacterized protein n=1 Tax=Ktedonobacter robiniae TaxID=2778365 RepID=A0ABQ3UYZ4_9CHLR|nr:hypothetical protein KSB_63520 [Ktedonobacter robiniae]